MTGKVRIRSETFRYNLGNVFGSYRGGVVSDGSELRLLKAGAAAACLGVSYRTLTRWIQDGTLHASKVGKRWRISEAEILRLMDAGRYRAKP